MGRGFGEHHGHQNRLDRFFFLCSRKQALFWSAQPLLPLLRQRPVLAEIGTASAARPIG
jgi:hypothetical protein